MNNSVFSQTMENFHKHIHDEFGWANPVSLAVLVDSGSSLPVLLDFAGKSCGHSQHKRPAQVEPPSLCRTSHARPIEGLHELLLVQPEQEYIQRKSIAPVYRHQLSTLPSGDRGGIRRHESHEWLPKRPLILQHRKQEDGWQVQGWDKQSPNRRVHGSPLPRCTAFLEAGGTNTKKASGVQIVVAR